ncbi:LysE family translocator [Rhizobium sp. KVB221]|uniref:LysE family translocator n=1 Tax=Rhizobium setariae TaxID=2801340 RepID=A0A936YRK8_9HYPH|nr:LysE family translocator [Rhizobium setariae]MBL0371055.1 LysE family translocator [Rhizobium setariae]
MPGLQLAPQLLPFLLASLLIELTPGPNMTWLAILTLSEGKARGLRAVAGISLGLALLGIAGALGVSEIINASQLIYQTLRWAGIAFLLYLAWDGWRGERDTSSEGTQDSRAFIRGLITNLLNPKAAVFYIAVLPAFIVETSPLAPQTWVLTTGYVLVATLVHAAIVLLAGQVQPLLAEPRLAMITRRVLSLGLVVVALWFAWSTRH